MTHQNDPPKTERTHEIEPEAHRLTDDEIFPNNERLPLLVYPNAVPLPDQDPASAFEKRFAENGWSGSWRNGIFTYHHYHSTAHEVLGVYRGTARVRLGGDNGIERSLGPGDVVVIPAGVAHKNLESSSDFGVVGAYPGGKGPDMNYGDPEERPAADRNIEQVPLPEKDPVLGENGPLRRLWTV